VRSRIQLADRFVDVILREPHEAEQPVQPQRGEASALRELSILDGGALTKHGLGLHQAAARDVDHRD